MRFAALIAASLMLVQTAHAAQTPEIDPRASLNVVQQWIYNYRAKPDYAHVPAAVRVLQGDTEMRCKSLTVHYENDTRAPIAPPVGKCLRANASLTTATRPLARVSRAANVRPWRSGIPIVSK